MVIKVANIIRINGKNVKDSNAAAMASLAPVESSTTASMAHAVGEYFWLNGTFYEATAAIAIGNTITVGTNCIIAYLGNELSDLKARIPAPPNTDGTYTLQANVSSGTVTYTWISAI